MVLVIKKLYVQFNLKSIMFDLKNAGKSVFVKKKHFFS